MTSEEIKKGDVVMLKSGGPVMTVVGVDKYGMYDPEIKAKCQWFAGSDLKEDYFTLESIEKEEP